MGLERPEHAGAFWPLLTGPTQSQCIDSGLDPLDWTAVRSQKYFWLQAVRMVYYPLEEGPNAIQVKPEKSSDEPYLFAGQLWSVQTLLISSPTSTKVESYVGTKVRENSDYLLECHGRLLDNQVQLHESCAGLNRHSAYLDLGVRDEFPADCCTQAGEEKWPDSVGQTRLRMLCLHLGIYGHLAIFFPRPGHVGI